MVIYNKLAVSVVSDLIINFNAKTLKNLKRVTLLMLVTSFLSACGSGGGTDSGSVNLPSPTPSPTQPSDPIPDPTPNPTPVPSATIVPFDFVRLADGQPIDPNQMQSRAFSNAKGNFKLPIRDQNLTGNITVSVDVDDLNSVQTVFVAYNGHDKALALTCFSTAACATTFHATHTGFNPLDFGATDGVQILELWVDDGAGNRTNVDLVEFTWQKTQITGITGEHLNNVIDMSWNPLSNYLRYNVYIASEDGLTPDNYQSKTDGRAFLALRNPFTVLPNAEDTKSFFTLITAVDGSGESAFGQIQKFDAVVGAVNTPPVAQDDAITIFEDTEINSTLNLLDNDSDVESGTPTIVTIPQTPTSNGTLTINTDGTFAYKPRKDFVGLDFFIYEVMDGGSETDTAIVRINVDQANDPPEPSFNKYNLINSNTGAKLTGQSNAQLQGILNIESPGVLINDLDIDSANLTVLTEPDTPPTKGTLELHADGSFIYTTDVAAGVEDMDSFTYRTVDSTGAISAPSLVEITINGISSPPVAANDNYTLEEDSFFTADGSTTDRLSVLSNDSNADVGDTLSVGLVRNSNHGFVTLSTDGTFTYSPNTGYFGVDTFLYQVTDSFGNVAQAAGILTVTRKNEPPSARPDTYSFDEDTTLTASADTGLLKNDTDLDLDPISLNTTPVTPPASGTLTLASDGSFIYVPASNATGIVTFQYEISDNLGLTATATVTLSIKNINDPPEALDDTAQTLGNTAVNITVLTNDSDPENNQLTVTSATVPSNTGTVVINPNNSLTYTPSNNFEGKTEIDYNISDNNEGTASAKVFVSVGVLNDVPVANNDSYTLTEDIQLVVDGISFATLLANDTDADGDTLTVQRVNNVSNGTLVLSTNGTFTYQPNPNFAGNDSFRYQALDGEGGANSATVNLTITAVNDNPTANPDTAGTAEETLININVLSNDSDVENGPLTITDASALFGLVEIMPNNTLNYTPNVDYVGNDTITYFIADNDGGTASGTVLVTISNINDAPITENESAVTFEDVPVTVNVLQNDSDVDGDTLIVSQATASNGSAVINADNTITYTPNTNFNGADRVDYVVSDQNGGTANGFLNLSVIANNDAPVANNDIVSTPEETLLTIDVLSNDTDDDGDALTVVSASASNGLVSLRADNQLDYQPTIDFNGTVTINYGIEDGQGGSSSAIVTVTVTPVNDAPIAMPDGVTTAEDSQVFANVVANDTDVDSATLTLLSGQANNGTVEILTGQTLGYLPNLNFHGSDTITYLISDNDGEFASGIVNVTIEPTNDLPIAVDDTATTNEEIAVTVAVLANDSDIDGDTLVVSNATAANGATVINSDNSLTYTPNKDYIGSDTINYTISDQNGGTASAKVVVTIFETNDNPVAVADAATTPEDTLVNINVLANDSDLDSPTLTITSAVAASGLVAITAQNTLDYTPNANFNGSDTIEYSISDNEGGTANSTVALTITAVNDAPVAVADTATTNEDTEVVINVLANDSDIDDEILTVKSAITSSGGSSINPDNTLTFFPQLHFEGTATIDYIIADAQGLTASATVTVTVTALNDLPVARDDSAVTFEDQPVSIDVLVNDSDADGDTLTVTASSATNGTITSTNNNIISFSPNQNFNGQTIVNYTISDGNSGTASATVTIHVTPVNDSPIAVVDQAVVNEDSTNTITVLTNDTDVDGDTLTITSASSTHGRLVINAGQSIDYTPPLNFNGTDIINYDISDANGGVDSSTVTITVTAVNDTPVALNDTATVNEDVGGIIDVLINDSDVDTTDVLNIVSATSANGVLTVVDVATSPKLNFIPNLNFNGETSIEYVIADNSCAVLTNCGNGHSATATVTVIVQPINDAPTISDATASVAENAVNGTAVVNVIGSDIDDTVLVYSITAGNTDSIFAINTATGAIAVADKTFLDFETTKSYTLIVNVADAAQASASAQVTITVTEVIENVTPTTDSTFGNTTLTGLAASNAFAFDNADTPEASVMDSTGRIIVVGSVTSSTTDFTVSRYLADGRLDHSFGIQGIFNKELGAFETAKAVAVDTSNNIYIAGEQFNGTAIEIFIVKVLASGQPDNAFGNSGVVISNLSISNLHVADILAHSDGTLAVGASINSQFALYKYNAATGADIASTAIDMNGDFDKAEAIAEQADGKVIIAGHTADSANRFTYDFAVARLNYSDLTLDTTFASTGKKTFDLGQLKNDMIFDVVVGSSGDIVTVGSITQVAGINDVALAVIDSTGVLKTNIGTGGVLIIDADGDNGANTGNSLATAAILDASNNLYLGVQFGLTPALHDFGLVKILSGGSIDTSFGTTGIVKHDLGSGQNTMVGVMLDSSSRPIAATSTPGSRNQDFALARFSTAGALDTSFVNRGYTTTNHTPSDDLMHDGIQLTGTAHSGKFVFTGAATNNTSVVDMIVARYNTTGSIDTTFAIDGYFRLSSNSTTSLIGKSVVELADGRIVVAGVTGENGFVLMLDTNGKLDTSFDTDGIKTFSNMANGVQLAINSVNKDNNDKIVFAGFAINTATDNSDLYLGRLNLDGSMDSTFGSAGEVVQELGTQEAASEISILTDNSIIVVGSKWANNQTPDNKALIAKFLSTGVIDTTGFGADSGYLALDVDSTVSDNQDVLVSVAVATDGTVYGAGRSSSSTTNLTAVIALNKNGTLKSSFGTNGISTFNMGSGSAGRSLALDSNGKLLVTGVHYNATNGGDDIYITRIGTDGVQDPLFSNGNHFDFNYNNTDDTKVVLALPDGRVLMAGFNQVTGFSTTVWYLQMIKLVQ